MATVYGADVIAIPRAGYYNDFARNPASALLQFGSLPARAQAPYFTDPADIEAALVLPDQVVGPRSDQADVEPSLPDAWPQPRRLIAHRDPRALLGGLSPTFYAPPDESFWHASIDFALNTGGASGDRDRAGFALGRIGRTLIDRDDETGVARELRTYEVPLTAQIAAPPGGQIILGSIVQFILALKTERGFNITSFSADGFQSADAAQQLVAAGLVTAGMKIDEESGEIIGNPKAYSVDRTPRPYREVLEAAADRRLALPRYGILRRELRALELPDPGKAPDHPKPGGPLKSKDVADAVAGCVGYLAEHGHAVLVGPGESDTLDRADMEAQGFLDPPDVAGLDGDMGYEDTSLD